MENHLEYPSSDDHFSNHFLLPHAIVEARKPDISISSFNITMRNTDGVGLNKINGYYTVTFASKKSFNSSLFKSNIAW
jgi:hypothetical protein